MFRYLITKITTILVIFGLVFSLATPASAGLMDNHDNSTTQQLQIFNPVQQDLHLQSWFKPNASVLAAPLGGITAISAGGSHACALTNTGGVKCWGANWSGQLGDGTTTDRAVPIDVDGLSSGVTAIAAGALHSCALTNTGAVKCWGEGSMIGDGTTSDKLSPVDVSGLTSGVVAISAGDQHTCALTATGGVKCWGINWDGRLGDGTYDNSITPVDVVGLSSGVVAISAGNQHTCVIMSTGGAKCWGNNDVGQLGDGTTTEHLTPIAVVGTTSGVSAISAGGYHTCIITSTGGAKCWGNNGTGQLGIGTYDDSLTPLDVSGLTSGVAAISAGSSHTCIITNSSGAKCWGANYNGQLGDSTTTERLTPVNVSELFSGVTTVSAGADLSCATTSTGVARCWGSNDMGQLGKGDFGYRSTPSDVFGLTTNMTTISAGGGHACALNSSGELKCWGNNDYGQIGDSTTTHRTTPVNVTGMTSGVAAISGGKYFTTCAINSLGGANCWGDNFYGQLGDGSQENSLVPVGVVGLTSGIASISAGAYHTCALTNAGAVKCWGANWDGRLGDGSSIRKLIPVDVVGLTTGVIEVSSGNQHTCAVTSAGGAKCWGANSRGQLGDGTTSTRLTPVDVVGLTSGIVAISAGNVHTCALTSTGGVKCWGTNWYGQLGDGTFSNRLTPVDVVGLTSGVVAISVGTYNTCALTDTGSVKCWGNNATGQLGNGTTTPSPTPVDVSDLTSGVSAISVGIQHSCALTNLGGIKCWGYKGDGLLGDGSLGYSSVPVDVWGPTDLFHEIYIPLIY